nr:hypothetical protein [Gemmatimonadales bacterium]
MTSPRLVKAAPHQRKDTLALLGALVLVLSPVPCRAQSTVAQPDSSAAAAPDSAAAGGSRNAGGAVAAGDTVQRAAPD